MDTLLVRPPPPSGSTRIKPGRRDSLRQVLDLQRVTHEIALQVAKDAKGTTKPEERARAASALANRGKSWNTLQDAKRVILGRPAHEPPKYDIRNALYHSMLRRMAVFDHFAIRFWGAKRVKMSGDSLPGSLRPEKAKPKKSVRRAVPFEE